MADELNKAQTKSQEKDQAVDQGSDQPDKTEPTKAEKQTVKTSVPEVNSRRPLFQSLLNLVLLLSVIGVAYFSWLQMNRVNSLLAMQSSQENLISDLEAQFTRVQDQLELAENNFASTETLINQQNARLENLNEELAALRLGINNSGGNNRVVQLNEAASILRLAQNYLTLGQDLAMVRNLYQRSSNLLSQIDDPAVSRISELLRNDLQALNNARAVDISGLFLQLSEAASELASVRLGPGIRPSDEYLDAERGTGEMVEGLFARMGNFFNRYFVIRRIDEPVQIPFDIEQLSYLQQNLQLQIQQAKLGLLMGRQGMYQDSISEVLRLSEQYIADSSPGKEGILRSLRQLQAETVTIETPPLSNALGLLESLLLTLSSDQ